LLDCAAHAALAGLTALSWLGLGTLLVGRFGTGDVALDTINRIGVGAAAFALSTFAAALVHALYRGLYWPVFAACAAVGAVAAVRAVGTRRRARPRGWSAWEQALLVLLALYVVLAVAATCAPVSSADALLHHAAAPERYAETHRFFELPWTWNSYQPYNVEMLVLDGFLLWDDVQGAFAPLLLSLAALAVVVGAATRLGGRGIGLLAGAAFFAQAFVLWLATSTFAEPGSAAFVALAAWNLVQFHIVPRTPTLMLAGVFAGAAAGTKYLAAAAAAILALVAVPLLRTQLTPRRALAAVGVALVVAAPWYVKNALVTGDPAYPLLRGWPSDQAREEAEASFDNYGHGRAPLDLVLLPFRLLGDAERFDRAEFLSPLCLLFAPLALLAQRGRRVAAFALGGCSLFLVVWFLGVQDARFLLSVLPVLAVLAAFGIAALATAGRIGRVVAVGVTTLALVVGLGVSAVYASRFAPYLVGAQSEDEFLRRNVSYHDATRWLNANLPADARVVLGHVLVLHVDRPTIAWTADALPLPATRSDILAFFGRYDLTHAAVFERSAQRAALERVGARRLARITVRPVASRARAQLGPPTTMLVYELPTPPRAD
jgi:hypothetical protein